MRLLGRVKPVSIPPARRPGHDPLGWGVRRALTLRPNPVLRGPAPNPTTAPTMTSRKPLLCRVSVRVANGMIEIVQHRHRRWLWFWRRCERKVLAMKPWHLEQGDRVELRMFGETPVVFVNDIEVLREPPLTWGRGYGIGVR